MKRIINALTWICLLGCVSFFSGCTEKDKLCVKCNANYTKQRKIKQITHQNAFGVLQEKYTYFYQNALIDSINKTAYHPESKADSVVSKLKAFYPSGECLPSAYAIRTYKTGSPISLEKAIMTVSGNNITNKHIAFYEDADYLAVNKTIDIDYNYNASGQVTNRNGTDWGLMVMSPSPYGNENQYTYTGSNISFINSYQEQGGYTLTKVFGTGHNPFNLQSGVFFYLDLISYPDDEHFETLSLDKNNVTQIVYHGTDTSNERLTITYNFTYTFDSANYPTSVAISKTEEDEVYGSVVVTNLGTYNIQYY